MLLILLIIGINNYYLSRYASVHHTNYFYNWIPLALLCYRYVIETNKLFKLHTFTYFRIKVAHGVIGWRSCDNRSDY